MAKNPKPKKKLEVRKQTIRDLSGSRTIKDVKGAGVSASRYCAGGAPLSH